MILRPFALAGLLLASVVPVRAAEMPRTESPVVEPAAPSSAPAHAATAVRVRKPSPLAVAITALLETERGTIAALEQRLAATKDRVAALALRREIEQVKIDAEIQVLALQAAHHRGNGRADLANQLDAVIRTMKNPPRAFEPASRPAPSVTDR
jgi:hypothetical protein